MNKKVVLIILSILALLVSCSTNEGKEKDDLTAKKLFTELSSKSYDTTYSAVYSIKTGKFSGEKPTILKIFKEGKNFKTEIHTDSGISSLKLVNSSGVFDCTKKGEKFLCKFTGESQENFFRTSKEEDKKIVSSSKMSFSENKTLAGTESICFNIYSGIVASNGITEFVQCYNNEGVLTYNKQVQSGNIEELTLTNLSKTIDKTVFRLQ